MRCKGTAFFWIRKTFRQKITLFLAFFLENNCIFLNHYIKCNLHFAKWYVKSGLLVAFICFLYLLHLCSPKNHLCSRFLYMVLCACTLYIGKTPKTLLFAVCSRFRVLYVVSYISFLVRLYPSFSVFVFTRFLFHENYVWNIMQVSVCLCKFNMYIYARYYDK